MKYEEFSYKDSYFKSKLKNSEENNSFSKKKRKLFEKLRHADLEDYTSWLEGFIKSGGRPTHYRYYYFIDDEFFVAKHDFWMVPLYGAEFIKIIVPQGIRCLGGELGHSELYFLEDFSCSDNSFVRVYSDIRFNEPFLNDILRDFIIEERGKDRFNILRFLDLPSYCLEKNIHFRSSFLDKDSVYASFKRERSIDEILNRIRECGLKSIGQLSDNSWDKTLNIFVTGNFDIFKGKVDEFGNYFSDLDGKIKEAIIRMILEEDLKDEKILSWLEENERSLIRKLTFN